MIKRIGRACLHLDSLLLGLVALAILTTGAKLLITGQTITLSSGPTITAGTLLLLGSLLGGAVLTPAILRRRPRLGNALSLGLLAAFFVALLSAAR